MKKITLLFLTASSLFSFGQNIKTTDISFTKPVEKKTLSYKIPSKPAVSLAEYYAQSNAQNLVAPKLYSQFPFTTSTITSQQFETENAAYNSTAADDFTVPASKIWEIKNVSARGYSISANYPTSYNVTFYKNSALNLPDTVIRTETVTLSAGSTNPTLPLANALFLTEGKYWISIQAVLNYTGGGQWFWETYSDAATLSAPFAWKNPGTGFETTCNAYWNTASVCIPGQLKDLQFTLDGVESNACKTILGRISTTDLTHPSRILRDGNSSTCGTSKSYPGNLNSGNYHYKTYTLENTTGTADCVTLLLKNTDPNALNQIHMVAYNETFNPNNLSENYAGDLGNSSFNGTISQMNITIPANKTLVLVVSETISDTTFNSDFTLHVISPNCAGILKTLVNTVKTISIYPNPVQSILFIKGVKVKTLQVFDGSGKLILTKNSESQLNVENLSKGIYLLKITDNLGKIHQEKFIKK